MIYTLPYESESLLRDSYFGLRKVMDPAKDIIHLTVARSHLNDESTDAIYKKALRLEGLYRTEYRAWSEPTARVRVVNQL